MRDSHGFNKKFLKARLHCCLYFLDPTHQLLDLLAGTLVEQGNAGTRTSRIASRTHLAEIAIRDHAKHHRILDINMAAKGTRQPDAVDFVDPHSLHEQPHAGIQSRLAQLNGTHIVLHNFQSWCAAACPVEFIGEGTPISLYPRVAHGKFAADRTVLTDDAGQVHLCEHLDDARTANPGHARHRHRVRKAGCIRPELTANHLEAGLQGVRVNAYPLNGARRGPLPATDLRPLKSRPGRARTGQQALPVAQHDFGIGTHIDQQADPLGEVGPLSQDHASCISPYMSGNTGQDINARIAVDVKVNLHRPKRHGAVGGEGEGRAAKLHRVDTQQQVVHDGVTNKAGLQNILRRNSDLLRHILGKFIERRPNHAGHLALAARVHHHIGHPAHEVFTKTNLRVHDAGRGNHLARGQVAQVRGNRG